MKHTSACMFRVWLVKIILLLTQVQQELMYETRVGTFTACRSTNGSAYQFAMDLLSKLSKA